MTKSILFVCTGNSCRSVMAEAITRKRLYELGRDDIDVRSAGVWAQNGLPPSEGTINVLKEEGIDASGFRTKNITPDMIKKADLILTMEPAHNDKILKLVPAAESRTFLLKEYKASTVFLPNGYSVRDPMGKPVEEYRSVLHEIKAEIERFVKVL